MLFLDLCEDSNSLSFILFVKQIINLISIVVPIVLILMLSVEFLKMVFSSDDKVFSKGIKGIVTKAIAAVAIFFVPTLVNLLLSLMNRAAFNDSICWINAEESTIQSYRAVEEAQKKMEEEKIRAENEEAERVRKAKEEVREKTREENEKKAKEEAKKKKEEAYSSSGNSSSGSTSSGNTNTGGMNDCNGSYNGTKYNLTDQEISELARMVKGEYGSDLVGMKAVASHMANLYEYRKSNNATKGQSLYQYITTCGWYATARANVRLNPSYNDARAQQAVKDVLVNGNRTLPLYIDEFDMFPGDILGASMNDAASYQAGVTRLNNRYGSSGTYFCITRSGSDANIFFYTDGALRYKEKNGL